MSSLFSKNKRRTIHPKSKHAPTLFSIREDLILEGPDTLGLIPRNQPELLSLSEDDVADLLSRSNECGVLQRKKNTRIFSCFNKHTETWRFERAHVSSVIPRGDYDFVIMRDGDIRALPSLFPNTPAHVYVSNYASHVRFAGVMKLDERGQITSWNNCSCDYPSSTHIQDVDVFRQAELPLGLFSDVGPSIERSSVVV